ncbi:adenosine deaminase [Shewanella sp. VB17]|uniref:adenosine deaminase n=1 Tax=Shewanella sp. VB17 TaxID=2739432 RepID=UPI0015664949|nr:adenosine deaminase [Shewanella sp. VB17]NRD73068.1 adenosine deaminase [Shewanella sp. VB17]
MNYHALPKIDLHCHLDGSVRPKTMIELANLQDVTIPSQDINEISALMTAPETCQNLEEYLMCFDLPLSVMQTEAGIERISFELFEDAAKENVKYFEVRFGPQLHQQQGLSLDQIIGSAVKGMQRAQVQYGIKGNYILSILRTMDKSNIHDVIDVGAAYLNKGVVAFDLAGAELAGFCNEFIPYVDHAIEKGYRITIHAGEQGIGQNVFDAVTLLNAERIGHGIDIKGHQKAYDVVKMRSVALESCPSSNIQTKAVDTLSQHPIKEFYKDGVLITINTDNRTVSNTTMVNEIRKVMEEFHLTREDYFAIYKVSVAQSFASDQVKQELLKFIE